MIANSITEFIANFTNDIHNGLYSTNEEALKSEQHFLEVHTQIDIINCHKIENWKVYVYTITTYNKHICKSWHRGLGSTIAASLGRCYGRTNNFERNANHQP